ncbi:hypothetical protein RPE78_00585 [Thioclava litoralis]|uniref:Nickel/cobalt transporter regulator n=1 Tax=Thioclava litoralis TaxID=3076557 RepID=A0ABZ1E155_9RHOB|nr:hypothetical protein RPE78_00585 [Thioclava sp. FTW29]
MSGFTPSLIRTLGVTAGGVLLISLGLSAPAPAQTVLRGGNAINAPSNREGAALVAQQPESERDCKTLSTGSTFCRVPGTQGVRGRWVLQAQKAPEFAVGDDFPIYQHSMLMDLRRYDLPNVDGDWRYYKVGRHIYRVDARTKKVLSVVEGSFR